MDLKVRGRKWAWGLLIFCPGMFSGGLLNGVKIWSAGLE
jgi:hypothetical protein